MNDRISQTVTKESSSDNVEFTDYQIEKSIVSADKSVDFDNENAKTEAVATQSVFSEEGVVTEEKNFTQLAELSFECECLARKNQQSILRMALSFSLVGLILSVFCGLGILFSIVGIILSYSRGRVTNSQTLILSRRLGYLGGILNALIITIVSVFLIIKWY